MVCANFTMLVVLFIGLGILLFQSISLDGSLKSDLQRAEQSVARLRERVERIEPDAAVRRIVGTAVGSIREEVRWAVTESETMAARFVLLESLERASAAADEFAETLQDLNPDAIARRESYEPLRGMGEPCF